MGLFDRISIPFFKKKEGGDEPSKDEYASTLGLNKPITGTEPEQAYDQSDRPRPYQQYGTPYSPPSSYPTTAPQAQFATQENMKAKMDLIMAQIESVRLQSEAMNERLAQTERMVKQLLEIAKARSPF